MGTFAAVFGGSIVLAGAVWFISVNDIKRI